MYINALPSVIPIGKQGENHATTVEIDAAAWGDEYPGLTIAISMTTPQDSTAASPFLVSGVTLSGDTLTWVVGNDATQYSGLGTIVVRGLLDGTEVRSARTQILIDPGHPATGDAPELMADWLAEADALRQEVADGAAAAADSADTATTKAGEAASSAQAASTSAGNANTAKLAAESARDTSVTKAGEAAHSAEQAAESAAVYDTLAGTVAGHTTQLAEIATQMQVHRYGIFWDEVNATCKRLYDALNTTLTTTNFGHFGSVNASYANPFDTIQPWAGRKCVNIDVAAYQALSIGADIKDCITAWEGDPDFEWDGTNGPVMVYTPEFWATDYAVPGGHVYIVADGELPGYTHFEETIGARWFASDDGSGGLTSAPNVIPMINVAMSTIHSKATSKKMTLDDIFTWCADSILLAVEYATLNSQYAIGNGVDNVYKQGDRPAFNESGVNRVILTDAVAANYIVGGIIDIGTTDGAYDTCQRVVTSVEDYAPNSAYACVNFDGTLVNITTALFVSLHGKINTTDAEIGSKSGYIGTNSKSHAYYRGRVAHAGMWRYILGAYRQQNTGHIWVARSRNEAAAYDALNTAVHADTGFVLPQGAEGASTSGYTSALHRVAGMPLAPLGKTLGGNSASPIGDYTSAPALSTGNTILLAGGGASAGAGCGRFCGYWYYTASISAWLISGLPFLKTP